MRAVVLYCPHNKRKRGNMLKNKPFTVTYYSAKDKKTITRNALWTDQCRYWTSKAGRLIMTYFDVDKNEYRNATDTWSIR
tara:strand:- start:4 stop:243 length:240 start_codon:yes stop_codon:yes gene_type:complete